MNEQKRLSSQCNFSETDQKDIIKDQIVKQIKQNDQLVCKYNVFWFRRDLRLNDNNGLFNILKEKNPVIPFFIYDKYILDKIEDKKDAKLEFINLYIHKLQQQLKQIGSTMVIKYDTVENAFNQLTSEYNIEQVYTNREYETYSKERDQRVKLLLQEKSVLFKDFQDQVIFEYKQIKNDNGIVYSVFSKYSQKWLSLLNEQACENKPSESLVNNFWKQQQELYSPSLQELGFQSAGKPFPPCEINIDIIKDHHMHRDRPSYKTSRIGVHLRYGTMSIRQVILRVKSVNIIFLNELIWREYYMMISDRTDNTNSKGKFDNIIWRNNEKEFTAWCKGQTGYTFVDAGMRQLNETGFMHNRLRMVTASFLTKHLLIDWRWGEKYFSQKLLDYDFAISYGCWQWSAGTGYDSEHFVRVFNPDAQQKKYDFDCNYITTWIKDLRLPSYPRPIVEHNFAKQRFMKAFKKRI